MNIGIIVHSQTGNTLSVAERLRDTLSSAGHAVSLGEVSAVNGDETDASKIRFNHAPEAGGYDAILFGAPVQGFSLSPVMTAYMSQAAILQGKKIVCFMTQFFPHPSMGGNRAIQQMCRICESKGAQIQGTAIVNWSSVRREKKITDTVNTICKMF